jgi:hypothetical protein
LEALLVTTPCSFVNPVVEGEKVTLTKTLWPVGTTKGKVTLDRLNSLLPRLTADTVTLVRPLLVNTTTSVSVCPIGTEPNRRLHGVQVNCWTEAPAHNGKKAAASAIVMMVKTRVEKG